MRTALDCIPCFARQALAAARIATDEPALHERAVREMLRLIARMDLADSPPAVAQQFHRRLRGVTGLADPYDALKRRFNRLALGMLDDLRTEVARSGHPLATAANLAIAGNVIDLGAAPEMTEADARAAVTRAVSQPLVGDIDALSAAAEAAERILYLADNAGEIVFDRLLIEQLPPGRVTVAVRGAPILNDATLDDARQAKLHELAELIDNGSDAPGTILADCSESFGRRYRRADLIIAKGQGNYESLSDCPRRPWFLLNIKCPVVAAHSGQPVGSHAVLQAAPAPAMASQPTRTSR